MKTVVLTMDHEGELPTGFLKAMEAKAYDFTMAKGVACGEVVAKPQVPPDPCPGCRPGGVCRTPKCGRLRSAELMRLYGTGIRLPVKEMRHDPQPYSLDGSPIKVNHE